MMSTGHVGRYKRRVPSVKRSQFYAQKQREKEKEVEEG